MRYTLLLFALVTGCTLTPSSGVPVTPSEKCHAALDAICEQAKRCEGQSEFDMCSIFMEGKIPFGFSYSGRPMNVRAQCDKVVHVGGRYNECMYGLQNTCEVPAACDEIKGY